MKYVWPVDLIKPFKVCNVVKDYFLNNMNAEEKYIVSRTENLLTSQQIVHSSPTVYELNSVIDKV
jgi:hypothetical protein